MTHPNLVLTGTTEDGTQVLVQLYDEDGALAAHLTQHGATLTGEVAFRDDTYARWGIPSPLVEEHDRAGQHTADCAVVRETSTQPNTAGRFLVTGYCAHGVPVHVQPDSIL